MKKKTKPESFVVSRNKEGKAVFAVPGSMTLGEWCKLGLPNVGLVAKNKPWKPNEARA